MPIPPRLDSTDIIRFRFEHGSEAYGWNGAWPPPECMSVLYGVDDPSMFSIFDPNDLDETGRMIHAKMLERGAKVVEYVRVSASGAPESAPPGEHWFRGADYAPRSSDGA